MTTTTFRGVLLLTVAIGLAACDRRVPAGPTPTPAQPESSVPGVIAISPSSGSTVRPTPVTISGSGFVAGATVTIHAVAAKVIAVHSTTIIAVAAAAEAGPADVVVTNPGGSRATLTAAFTYAVDEPFTVTSSTDTVEAGGQMSVSWTAPAARAGDWIAVFRVGASYEDEWWGNTGGATSGTLTLAAPTRPGQYEPTSAVYGRSRSWRPGCHAQNGRWPAHPL